MGRLRAGCSMPTLFRFLGFLALMAAIGFGGMLALVTFVQPEQRETSVQIPPSRFNR